MKHKILQKELVITIDVMGKDNCGEYCSYINLEDFSENEWCGLFNDALEADQDQFGNKIHILHIRCKGCMAEFGKGE